MSSVNILPRIKILATGGTIAAKGSSMTRAIDYNFEVGAQEMLAAIPDVSQLATIDYEQVCNVDSKDINQDILLDIYNGIKRALNNGYDGIVVTHGTDTLAETTYFIENTIDEGDTPIVFVGSLRPSTSSSPDGPMNLYEAICVAVDSNSKGRGVLVAINDQISTGYNLMKTSANGLGAFGMKNGILGTFVNNKVCYYFNPTKPVGCQNFDISNEISSNGKLDLPVVYIIYGHQCFDTTMIDHLAQHADGFVIAAMGSGTLPKELNNKLANLSVPVVYSKKAAEGLIPSTNLPVVESDKISNVIASGFLNPEKSRILLQLCLLKNESINSIREKFSEVYGG